MIELEWVCVPMVVEAYGAAWGAEAMESATSSNKARAAVLNSLYGRLNLNLVTANATRAPSPVCMLLAGHLSSSAHGHACRPFRLHVGSYIYIHVN